VQFREAVDWDFIISPQLCLNALKKLPAADIVSIRGCAWEYDLALTQRQAAKRKRDKALAAAAEAGEQKRKQKRAAESKQVVEAEPDFQQLFPPKMEQAFKVIVELKVQHSLLRLFVCSLSCVQGGAKIECELEGFTESTRLLRSLLNARSEAEGATVQCIKSPREWHHTSVLLVLRASSCCVACACCYSAVAVHGRANGRSRRAQAIARVLAAALGQGRPSHWLASVPDLCAQRRRFAICTRCWRWRPSSSRLRIASWCDSPNFC
jgi:hypothetical protein